MAEDVLVRVEDMHKHFGPTIALNGFSFSVRYGEIKGLIGENGSGKSTVSSIIAGAQAPTKGRMYFRGKEHAPKSMLEAQDQGISMIVQEAGTVSGISVAENIFAGKEKSSGNTDWLINGGYTKKRDARLRRLALRIFILKLPLTS